MIGNVAPKFFVLGSSSSSAAEARRGRSAALRRAGPGRAPEAAARGRDGGGGGDRSEAEAAAGPRRSVPPRPRSPPGVAPSLSAPGGSRFREGEKIIYKDIHIYKLKQKVGVGVSLAVLTAEGGWQAGLPLTSPREAVIELVWETRLPRGRIAESRVCVAFSEQEGK